MALSRLSVTVGQKGSGGGHAKYILAFDQYAKKIQELEARDWGNLPEWAKDDPVKFFEMADKFERANGTVYRDHLISLPRELDAEQRYKLVEDWIKQELGDKHAYAFAIHNIKAKDGKEQPHLHLMFSERIDDGLNRSDPQQYFKRYNAKNPERGGCKKDTTAKTAEQRKNELMQQRERWEKLANNHLMKAGFEASIDMRNYKERGELEQPEYLPRALYQAKQRLEKMELDKVITRRIAVYQHGILDKFGYYRGENQTKVLVLSENLIEKPYQDNLLKRHEERTNQKAQIFDIQVRKDNDEVADASDVLKFFEEYEQAGVIQKINNQIKRQKELEGEADLEVPPLSPHEAVMHFPLKRPHWPTIQEKYFVCDRTKHGDPVFLGRIALVYDTRTLAINEDKTRMVTRERALAGGDDRYEPCCAAIDRIEEALTDQMQMQKPTQSYGMNF
ncbi:MULTISPECIES: MobA/MobL family protein [unclassified Moraxella]|uniref:MobA/MobL family protein n=3 Tax=Moraxella TaxID=475 RepID=UPI002B4164FF|nr:MULTISPECIES: MobA/MobL family protein [unclassified Moraxella]